MKTKTLRGTLTALVTPMNAGGSIDFGALDALVDRQLAAKVEGLVPCGTTGEAVTLSDEERERVISRVVKRAADRVPVVAGTGGNDTQVAITNQKRARDAGATATLVATPYYNKPTQEGLRQHYLMLADAVEIPIVLYNVPSRTACDLSVDTTRTLARDTRFVGLKDATGDLNRCTDLQNTRKDFALLSGDDPTVMPFVAMGGDGVVSVAANLAPTMMGDMVRHMLDGDVAAARSLHAKLLPLFRGFALESNPIPVKDAMAQKGLLTRAYRLPLCPMTAENQTKLASILTQNDWA